MSGYEKAIAHRYRESNPRIVFEENTNEIHQYDRYTFWLLNRIQGKKRDAVKKRNLNAH